jgi:hypothetical protein
MTKPAPAPFECGGQTIHTAKASRSKGHFTLTCGDLGAGAIVGHHRIMLIDTWALPEVPDRREHKPSATRKVLEKPRIADPRRHHRHLD